MEWGTHHIVVVPNQNRDTSSRLPVPYSDCLIITCTNNPWILVVKLNSTNVIKMPKQGKQTPMQLVIPNLDLIIISWKKKGSVSCFLTMGKQHGREDNLLYWGGYQASTLIKFPQQKKFISSKACWKPKADVQYVLELGDLDPPLLESPTVEPE